MKEPNKQTSKLALPLAALVAGLGMFAWSHVATAADLGKPQAHPTPSSTSAATRETKVIHGKLSMKDLATRSFSLAGSDEIYTAPWSADLASLSGKEVRLEVRLDGTVASLTAAPPMAQGATQRMYR